MSKLRDKTGKSPTKNQFHQSPTENEDWMPPYSFSPTFEAEEDEREELNPLIQFTSSNNRGTRDKFKSQLAGEWNQRILANQQEVESLLLVTPLTTDMPAQQHNIPDTIDMTEEMYHNTIPLPNNSTAFNTTSALEKFLAEMDADYSKLRGKVLTFMEKRQI